MNSLREFREYAKGMGDELTFKRLVREVNLPPSRSISEAIRIPTGYAYTPNGQLKHLYDARVWDRFVLFGTGTIKELVDAEGEIKQDVLSHVYGQEAYAYFRGVEPRYLDDS